MENTKQQRVHQYFDFAMLAGIAAFLMIYFDVRYLFYDTVVTGGDTASWQAVAEHLARVLIPAGRLTGWASRNKASLLSRTSYFLRSPEESTKEGRRRRLVRPLARAARRGELRRSPLRGAGFARTPPDAPPLPRRAARRRPRHGACWLAAGSSTAPAGHGLGCASRFHT